MTDLETKIYILITYGSAECYGQDDNHECSLNVQTDFIPLHLAVESKSFLAELKNLGFYHQNDVDGGHEHTDEFIYAINNGYGYASPLVYRKNILNKNDRVVAIYQRVVGGKTFEETEKHTKKVEKKIEHDKKNYEKQQEERKAKAEERKIAKAQKLLKEKGLLSE